MRLPLLDKFNISRLCPFCIKEFYPGDSEIISTTTGKVLKPAPRGWQRYKARISPEPLTGHAYTKELACRKCPHCSYLLPFNIERVRNFSIAVVGDTSSGKSWYLAALINQL